MYKNSTDLFRIARNIAEEISPLHPEEQLVKEKDVISNDEIRALTRSDIERYYEPEAPLSKHEPADRDPVIQSYMESDEKLGGERQSYKTTRLDNDVTVASLRVFFDRIRICRFLPVNFGLLLVPKPARQILTSFPPHRVWLTLVDRNHFSNKIKAYVEDSTEAPWDWWPLRPTERPLQLRQARMQWTCVRKKQRSCIRLLK